MATALCNLYYRHKGSNKTLTGTQLSGCKTRGLYLCWRYGSKADQIACAKLVRKGSAWGGSGLFVRHNGIIFEASPHTLDQSTALAFDDCGQAYELYLSNITCSFDDGWYFGGKSYFCLNPNDSSFTINTASTWTIAFKVKGTTSTGSSETGVIAVLSATGYWIIGSYPERGECFFFCMRKNGQLFFRDYFQTTVFDGNRTDWRDFKITFYPTNTITYNEKLKTDVRLVNFTAVCNGVTKNGTTYFVYDSSEEFLFKIGHASNYVAKGDSTKENVDRLNGYIKYFHVSQDAQGYSDYRRNTHKVALYFD